MPPAARPFRPPPWSALRPGAGLSDAAWLAILLGPPAARWHPRAAALLARRDLASVSRSGAARLVREHGLPPSAAARIVAAFALARALERERRPARPALASARAVHAHVGARLRALERERFLALLLDGKHRLLREEPVSEGTLTSSLVHPREVFGAAVREGAAALVVVHNHPSGDPEPSAEDVAVTRRLRAAGELLGIPLLDHVVVAAGGYVSLRERIGSGLGG